MREYTPDYWLIVELWDDDNLPDEQHTFKLFSTWTGSFTYGDSWKLSSGITKVHVDGKTVVFENYSGSIYKVHEDAYRTTLYTQSVLQKMMLDIENSASSQNKMHMRVLSEDDAREFITSAISKGE